MLISDKKLKKVRVETQSGQYLGQVNSFELETDTGLIMKYYVRSKNLISGLFEDSLIINKDQVISLDETTMIVSDDFVKADQPEEKETVTVEKFEGVEPVITSKKS